MVKSFTIHIRLFEVTWPKGSRQLLPTLGVHRHSSVLRKLFLKVNSSETTANFNQSQA